jgi:Bacterial SH3 domain
VHVAKHRAASGTRFAEVRIFLGVFMIAAITTTVLGMGGPLGIPGLRESLGLEPLADSAQVEWGEIRWVHAVSRIRAARSTKSAVVGRLEPGDSVRVDYAQAGWYAVFPPQAAVHGESAAVGYVFGDLLKKEPPPDVHVPLVRILP